MEKERRSALLTVCCIFLFQSKRSEPIVLHVTAHREVLGNVLYVENEYVNHAKRLFIATNRYIPLLLFAPNLNQQLVAPRWPQRRPPQ